MRRLLSLRRERRREADADPVVAKRAHQHVVDARETQCTQHLALHAPVHNAAISKVRSVAAQLWPRAQVKTFGSFATGLMRPGSDIDLIVTLPPVRTTTAMPEAPARPVRPMRWMYETVV